MNNPKAQVNAINDPFMDTDYLIYLLKYDSVHGRFEGDIQKCDGGIQVNGRKIFVSHEKDPSAINWTSFNSDYICESSGAFTTKEKCLAH